MVFSPPPCQNCEGRYVGCHNDNACPAWTNWCTENERRKKEIESLRNAERVFRSIQAEKSMRINKRMHRK